MKSSKVPPLLELIVRMRYIERRGIQCIIYKLLYVSAMELYIIYKHPSASAKSVGYNKKLDPPVKATIRTERNSVIRFQRTRTGSFYWVIITVAFDGPAS